MGADAVHRGSGPRTALVLGAGGVLGAAWMTGALPTLQELLPCPVNDVDVIVGTSAGSVLAAALRCGASIEEMIAFQRGEAAGPLAGSVSTELTSGAWPPLPRLRMGSARLALSMLVAPGRVHPWVGASGLLPRGRGTHLALHEMVYTLHSYAYRQTAPDPLPHWVDGQTWIVTVDYDSGQRVIFGRPGAPPARLPEAVVASCSIPGWYEPAVIGGRRYIDGGVRSATSLDVLARAGVEDVYVLAPMASTVTGRGRKPVERLERRLRGWITLTLLREARELRRLGTRVTVITPGPEDLAVIGVNLMDPRRRRLVLETSLRTSRGALGAHGEPRSAVA